MRSTAWYGWVPDVPDQRDRPYGQLRLRFPTLSLPPKVDLRERGGLFPVYDQGPLGSCTGQAIAKALTFNFFHQQPQPATPILDPSRLFIYYNERAADGTTEVDAGAQIRTGIKVAAQLGVCGEGIWPYDLTRWSDRPPEAAYAEALNHQALAYHRLSQELGELKDCLATGFPFIFGFAVYESFESEAVETTGWLPMPGHHESMLGAHAVLCVGYDDRTERFIVQNSWGADWGDHGFFYMPYDYATDGGLAADFWVVTLQEDAA